MTLPELENLAKEMEKKSYENLIKAKILEEKIIKMLNKIMIKNKKVKRGFYIILKQGDKELIIMYKEEL